MDISKIDKILQLALAAASNNEFGERELGPIHLIKYVYLTDLAYAKSHNGQTYTGVKWKFHNYGPWAVEVFNRIEPALLAINANEKRIYSDKYEDDFFRWSCSDSGLFDELLNESDVVAALPVKGFVQEYGANTNVLLHDVYRTEPMLNAAPGEYLDFSLAVKELPELIKKKHKQLSIGQLKRLNAKREGTKKRIQERLKRRIAAKKSKEKQMQPRYDEVYFEGLRVLDRLAGEEHLEGRITCSLSDDIWKSKARHDPDLS